MGSVGNWYWLSFADADLPAGSQFLGVALVGPSTSIAHAAMMAHAHGCNPGGGIMGHIVPSPYIDRVPDSFKFTLLTKKQAQDVDEIMDSVNRESN